VTGQSTAAQDLRAVLFDSGGVLMQPIGGRWNPRADFEQTVLASAAGIARGQFAAAIAAGDRFMAGSATTPDYDDYHRVILRHLGVEPAPALLADLRRPVEPAVTLETFPDVPGTLRELRRRGVPMAVVSDAWPNLPDKSPESLQPCRPHRQHITGRSFLAGATTPRIYSCRCHSGQKDPGPREPGRSMSQQKCRLFSAADPGLLDRVNVIDGRSVLTAGCATTYRRGGSS
jgi:hypothetical protein